MRAFVNDTSEPVALTWCVSVEHYANGQHPDPDDCLRTVTVEPVQRLTYGANEANADDIAANILAATGGV